MPLRWLASCWYFPASPSCSRENRKAERLQAAGTNDRVPTGRAGARLGKGPTWSIRWLRPLVKPEPTYRSARTSSAFDPKPDIERRTAIRRNVNPFTLVVRRSSYTPSANAGAVHEDWRRLLREPNLEKL